MRVDMRLPGPWRRLQIGDRDLTDIVWSLLALQIYKRGEDDVFAFVDMFDDAQHLVAHGHWQWTCTCNEYALSEGDCAATLALRLLYLRGEV